MWHMDAVLKRQIPVNRYRPLITLYQACTSRADITIKGWIF